LNIEINAYINLYVLVELKDAGTVNRTVVSKANMTKMAKAEEVSYQGLIFYY
jgi:hypothetical protein